MLTRQVFYHLSYASSPNNTLLNDQWVTEEIGEEIKRLLESNENENATYQNLWGTTKAVLRERESDLK
jgi:hypothetical protein